MKKNLLKINETINQSINGGDDDDESKINHFLNKYDFQIVSD